MTDPDHLTHFWGPKGVSAPREGITVDARPGGVFETVMVNDSDGNEYATRAVYDEVRPPERLSWTEAHSGMRVTTEFVALGPDRTEVRIHQRYVPEAFLLPEVQAGFLSSLDRFDAYLAGWSHRSLPDETGSPEGGITMTYDTALHTDADLAAAVAEEYGALADLLEASDAAVWDAPSLCEGWRTREVVAHMTMPARYAGPAFMAELEAAGGDFTRLSNTVAARDGALPVPALLADLRSEVLHAWQPPGGGMEGALDALRDPRPRHHRGGPAGAAAARRARRPGPRHRRRSGRAQPLRRRPLRRGAAGRRPRLVVRLGRGGDRAGAGAGPRGVRPPAAAGPAGRRGGRRFTSG